MQLIPWSYHTPLGFSLRGYRTEPSGKPVLHMLHGNGFCSRMYQPMLQLLADDFDMFLSDAQGHGDSDNGGPFVGWNKSAELAVAAWQAHKHLYPAVAVYGVGHSFGGVLTALIHTTAPSPFNAAILLDPVLFTPTMLTVMTTLNGVRLYHRNPLAKAALRRRQHWPDHDTAKAYLTNRGMFANWHPDALASYIEHALKPSEHGLSLKCLPEREADIFASYPDKLWRQLARPCPPVHVIFGTNSYDFIGKALLNWQKRNPAISTERVSGGHCFMQEQPQLAAQRLLHAVNALNLSLK
ncbi:alpha/beta fold hydrolase [Rheinheimera maricola]|uniref:Alpha/beta hydrolase n=1 Tax=Rheinheimera maricola TaxID=2793282 RepID=A0ABS7X8A1_9GAMM|nr:alpha/beta hydrolase [Rheinheimera maricola]MBZ9611764.1 alpha/beta hydrolase [Rheinheimera maricola]